MKKYFIFLTLCSALAHACSNERETQKQYLEHVGNTEFNPELDTLGFEPCHDDQIVEYYNFAKGFQYEGEKIALERVFKLGYKQETTNGQTGYITIRFVVNCKGETGWFRIEEMGWDYKSKNFDNAIVSQLFNLTRSLKGWKVGKFDDSDYEEELFDYYQYLTFKIENGQILEILP